MSERTLRTPRSYREQRARPEGLLAQITAEVRERVEPACRHFGECGGCQLQDLSQPSQLAAKQAMMLDLLRDAGIGNLPALTVHAGEPYTYRNRARMRVEAGSIGYSRRASHEFLPIEECPIVTPLVWTAAAALRDLVRAGTVTWPAATASFELFANADESALQLSLQLDATVGTVERDAPQHFRMLADALHRAAPQLAGAGLLVSASPDPSLSKRIAESRQIEIARWGEAKLGYRVAGREYAITRNAFFQVNRYLTDAMVQTVVGGRRGALAYDLFAGAGLFSVPLTERFERVIAVEIGEPSASDLAMHLHARGPRHRALRSTALAFLDEQNKAAAPRPDLVVLDPPRAGLGPPTVRALIARNAREIVYVSCDAGTFALDAKPLVESGYTLTSLHLLDLFPQTFHTETIALFQR